MPIRTASAVAAALSLSLITIGASSCALHDESTIVLPSADAIEASAAECGKADCPKDSICITPVAITEEPIPAGRLAVVWYQLDDADPDPREIIAYQTRFDPLAGRIAIPRSAVPAPADEAVLLCVRDCDNETECPCRSEARFAIGRVVVAADRDGSGSLDAEEVRTEEYGRAQVVFVNSTLGYETPPAPFETVFAGPILRGTRPYVFDDSGDAVRIEPADRSEPLPLDMCARPATGAADECRPPWPEFHARL